MKHLFICVTPLQLMTAVNLRVSILADDEVVLYLLDHSPLHQEMFDNVSHAKVFTRVELLKTKEFNDRWYYYSEKYKIIGHVVKATEYLNYQAITLKLIDDTTVYDQFWISYMDRSSWMLFLSYKKRNQALQLLFFEDGLYSYRLLTRKVNVIEKYVAHFFGLKTVFEEMQTLYLYQPTLVEKSLYPMVKIQSLPAICDEKLKQRLNDVFAFEFDNVKLFEHRYLFFDANFNSEKVNQKQIESVDLLMEKVGDSFAIKLHPRSSLLKDKGYDQVISTVRTAMEMLCMNVDVSKNIFISVVSTVCITPKLMFNQEPHIIFLYKLVGLDKEQEVKADYFKFIEGMVDTYTHSERVFIPETIEELEEIIKKISITN